MLSEKVLSREQIDEAIERLAACLNAELPGREAVFVCVLKGAV